MLFAGAVKSLGGEMGRRLERWRLDVLRRGEGEMDGVGWRRI